MLTPFITFDCDGVLANFTELFTQLVNDQFMTDYSQHWTSYTPTDIMDFEHWDSGWELVRTTPFFWMRLNAHPEAPLGKIGAMLAQGASIGYVVSLGPLQTNTTRRCRPACG